MNEFSPRGGSVSKGILAAMAGAVMYVAIPYLLLASASSLLADAGRGDMVEQVGVQDIMGYVLMIGIPIIALSFLRGFYPKGSYSRAAMGVVVGVLLGLWAWTVTLGGRLDLQFEQFGLTLDVSGFVYLFLVLAALKGLFYLVEMVSYRKEWLGSKGVSRSAEGEAAS